MKFKIQALIGVILALTTMTAGCGKTGTTTTATDIATTTTIQNTPLSTSITTSPQSYSIYNNFNNVNSDSSISANGLILSLALDSKTYSPGQQVSIVIDEKNTLLVPNKVPVTDNWSYSVLAIDPCDIGPGNFGYPYGIAIFQGAFMKADYSGATPLALYDYGMPVPCPGPLPAGAYDFKPLSDIATISGSSVQYPDSTVAITTSLIANGYWTGARQDTSKHGFATGIYTIVAGDEWGALVVLHFTVTN